MTDTSTQPDNSDQENKLTSAQFDEFKEALEVLYVIANISARIQFAKNWPAAAEFVLGKDLIHYDIEGASPEDKEDRAQLEQEAEGKRIALLEFMDTLEAKSVEKGALQIEYVKEAMTKLGRPLSLLIYGEKLVDRFVPPSPEELKAAAAEAEGQSEESGSGASVEISPELPSEMPTQNAPPTSPVADNVPGINPDGPTTVNPDDLAKDLDDTLAAEVAGAPKIHHDPMDDVKPIDFAEPAPPKPTPSLDDQPIGADPVNPVVGAETEKPDTVPPLTAPPPMEPPPETMDKSDVAPQAAPSVPVLEEETAEPIEAAQAMAENNDAMTPVAPEPPSDVPPLTPPPSVAPPPPPPPPPVQEQPTEVTPRGGMPPPELPTAPVQPASQADAGTSQKPVAMKFVSSKDKNPDDTGDGDGETNQG